MTKRIDPDEAEALDEEVWDEDAAGPVRPRLINQEWLWEFNHVIGELNARDDIEVHTYEHYDPVSLFTLEQVETSVGIVVPDQIRSFYRTTNGLDLRWSWRDGDDWKPGGQVRMHPFGKVFGNWIDTIWGKAKSDAADVIDFTWELRGVEHQDSWGHEWMTVLHMPESIPFTQLYFHDPLDQTLMIDMDFVDYCDGLLDTLGVYGWQFLATEVDFDEQPSIREMAASARHTLERAFPEVDISHLRTLED